MVFTAYNDRLTNNSVFETTIRYLGGMLSAYELTGEKYPVLIKQAKTLADRLAFAWVPVRIGGTLS